MCQRPPSSARGDPNYYYFSLLSITEHAYTLPLLGLCRITASQLLFVKWVRRAFDLLLGCVLGPVCTAMLLAGPLFLGADQDLSMPADLAGWEAWLAFLLLAAVHLLDSGSSSRGAGARHARQAAAVGGLRGAVLCAGIICLHFYRRSSSSPPAAAERSSDFYLFRSFATRCSRGNEGGTYAVQGTLMLWLGLLASRWFEEVVRCLFFRRCRTCGSSSSGGGNALLPQRQNKAGMCMPCYSMHSMKEDVDDACASLAVAGILLGAYSISSSPLPEGGQQKDRRHVHGFTMLYALGILAAVVTGVHAVHWGARGLLLLTTDATASSPDGMEMEKDYDSSSADEADSDAPIGKPHNL